MEDKNHAPWTDEEVESIKGFQEAGSFHPFTCPEHTDFELIPYTEALLCPLTNCMYKQTWVHSFMADGSWSRI